MHEPTHVFLGYAPCGCVQAMACYHWSRRDQVVTDVVEWIREGLHPRVITWAEFQANPVYLVDCPHGEQVSAEAMQPALVMEVECDEQD